MESSLVEVPRSIFRSGYFWQLEVTPEPFENAKNLSKAVSQLVGLVELSRIGDLHKDNLIYGNGRWWIIDGDVSLSTCTKGSRFVCLSFLRRVSILTDIHCLLLAFLETQQYQAPLGAETPGLLGALSIATKALLSGYRETTGLADVSPDISTLVEAISEVPNACRIILRNTVWYEEVFNLILKKPACSVIERFIELDTVLLSSTVALGQASSS